MTKSRIYSNLFFIGNPDKQRSSAQIVLNMFNAFESLALVRQPDGKRYTNALYYQHRP